MAQFDSPFASPAQASLYPSLPTLAAVWAGRGWLGVTPLWKSRQCSSTRHPQASLYLPSFAHPDYGLGGAQLVGRDAGMETQAVQQVAWVAS